MAKYDEATFELAKRVRAKSAARLREAGYPVEDRKPTGVRNLRSDSTPTFKTGSESVVVTYALPEGAKLKSPKEKVLFARSALTGRYISKKASKLSRGASKSLRDT